MKNFRKMMIAASAMLIADCTRAQDVPLSSDMPILLAPETSGNSATPIYPEGITASTTESNGMFQILMRDLSGGWYAWMAYKMSDKPQGDRSLFQYFNPNNYPELKVDGVNGIWIGDFFIATGAPFVEKTITAPAPDGAIGYQGYPASLHGTEHGYFIIYSGYAPKGPNVIYAANPAARIEDTGFGDENQETFSRAYRCILDYAEGVKLEKTGWRVSGWLIPSISLNRDEIRYVKIGEAKIKISAAASMGDQLILDLVKESGPLPAEGRELIVKIENRIFIIGVGGNYTIPILGLNGFRNYKTLRHYVINDTPVPLGFKTPRGIQVEIPYFESKEVAATTEYRGRCILFDAMAGSSEIIREVPYYGDLGIEGVKSLLESYLTSINRPKEAMPDYPGYIDVSTLGPPSPYVCTDPITGIDSCKSGWVINGVFIPDGWAMPYRAMDGVFYLGSPSIWSVKGADGLFTERQGWMADGRFIPLDALGTLITHTDVDPTTGVTYERDGWMVDGQFIASETSAARLVGDVFKVSLPRAAMNVKQQCANTFTAHIECTDGTCLDKQVGGADTKAISAAAIAAGKEFCKKDQAPKTVSYTGSRIDNFTFNHYHEATDYAVGGGGLAGCSSCGAGAGSPERFAKVSVERVQSLRDVTVPASFGPGVFLNYDISLTLFDYNGKTYVDGFNPAWLGVRRYSPSGTAFVDAVYNSMRSLTLYDAAGRPTTTRAGAVRAVYVSKLGEQYHFELFDLDANRKGGRLTRSVSPGGLTVLGFEYAVAASDAEADPVRKWEKSVAYDAEGGRLSYTYEGIAGGARVLTKVGLPGGREIAYDYGDGRNLTAVTLPDGERSTFERTTEQGLLKVAIREAGAEGMHRNKTAYYTNNIATNLLTWDNNVRPAMYNQSSFLVAAILNGNEESTYWSVSGGEPGTGVMHRKVYEGGGRMKFIDTAENSAYTKWSADGGFNPERPFSSISATKEKYGHWSPWWLYAENRSGRPSQVTVPESPLHYFLYDGNGNMTLERVGDKVRRFDSHPTFNLPVREVDFSGHATLCAYDAAGNLVSRKTGWALDKALGAGAQLRGLSCAYYDGVADIDSLDALTPVSVMAADTVALGMRETNVARYGLRFAGKLVLERDGERTFRLSADDQARLYVDGALVLDVAYNQGAKVARLNLTPGAHDIRVDFVEFGGGKRLDLTWSGPETTDASGVPATTIIGSEFLAHETSADELVLRPTDAASEEKWEYFPAADPLAGLMRAHVDGAGKRTEYVYDAHRRPVQVKETGDNGDLVVTQTRTYDAAGNLASSADALGRKVEYTYDARNRLVKTAYGDDTTETVTYGTGDNANLVVARKDRAGSVTAYRYDASGRVRTTLVGYALADADGAITRMLENPSVETSEYLAGTTDVVRTVRDGKATEYDYDYKGRVVATRTFPAKDLVLSSLSRYSADEVLFSTTDAHGCRTFRAYRRPDMTVLREIRELTPGSLGNLADEAAVLAVARAAGGNPGYAVTDYETDADGRTVATVDPRGVRSTVAYDTVGRVVSRTAAAGLPEQQVFSTTYDGSGRPVAQTDPSGRVTRRTYTPAGRVASVVHPDHASESFRYFADGRLAERTDAAGFTFRQYYTPCCARDFASVGPKGEGALKFYDGLGRVTYSALVKNVDAVKDFGPNLPADAVVSAQTMRYDARGRLAASTKWLVVPTNVDPKHAPIATDPAQGLTTTYAYFDDLSDARFAPVLAKLAEQGVTLTTGSATVVTNPAGEQSFTVSDGAGDAVASGVFGK